MYKIGFFPHGAPTQVTIGTQQWSMSNLKVTTYRNGDPITYAANAAAFVAANLTQTGCYRYYADTPSTVNTYGLLYNSYAMQDPRNLAPTGYHIPTFYEYTELDNYLTSQSFTFGSLKSTTLWTAPNTGALNRYSYAAVPGGGVNDSSGAFYNTGINGYYWIYTLDALNPCGTSFGYNGAGFGGEGATTPGQGLSARLINNASITYGQLGGGGVIVSPSASDPIIVVYADPTSRALSTITTDWGCLGVNVGATGSGLGDGYFNTANMISSSCNIVSTLLGDSTNFFPAYGYNDWWIPSAQEFIDYFVTPSTTGKVILDTALTYWTSTETPPNDAIAFSYIGSTWTQVVKRKDYIGGEMPLMRTQSL